jgi:hypothetical protein
MEVLQFSNTALAIYKILVGKPEGKRPRGKRVSRWEDDIRMDFREIE